MADALPPDAMPLDPDSYVGSGWAFPPVFDVHLRSVVTVSGLADVLESLTILFKTNLGERILQPGYGSELGNLVFAAQDETTFGELKHLVTRAIQEHEPRIWLHEVVVGRSLEDPDRVDIAVAFEVRHTQSRASMVFPYYLSEGTQL